MTSKTRKKSRIFRLFVHTILFARSPIFGYMGAEVLLYSNISFIEDEYELSTR